MMMYSNNRIQEMDIRDRITPPISDKLTENNIPDFVSSRDVSNSKLLKDYGGNFDPINNMELQNNNTQDKYNVDFTNMNTRNISNNKPLKDYGDFNSTNSAEVLRNNQDKYNLDFTSNTWNENNKKAQNFNIANVESLQSKGDKTKHNFNTTNVELLKSKNDDIKQKFLDKMITLLDKEVDDNIAINIINKGIKVIDQSISKDGKFNVEMLGIGAHLIDQGVAILNRDINTMGVIQDANYIYDSGNDYLYL